MSFLKEFKTFAMRGNVVDMAKVLNSFKKLILVLFWVFIY